ncbi:MAG: phosphoribosylformylglycinamidine cyclo-ligase [bacterium]|nr:MAG: phosphoribosylformylglycinamidine cyclo-ligase [bacterium]
MKKSITYREAGVDIESAEQSLDKVKVAIAKTHNRQVLKNIGAFGGFYEFPIQDYRKPVLISSTDGVGTKLLVAMMMNKHDTVGQDLVNHCINDIAVCGAHPLFFLDYFGCGKLHPEVFQQIIMGFVAACNAAGLPLIGGETAEMPDLYQPGEYDLAGTIVGVVEKENIIDGQSIQAGDILIGISSAGLHTNGYSLARKVLFSKYQPQDYVQELGTTVGEELLKIHPNYYPLISDVIQNFPVKGLAHITGGGLYKNTTRIIPNGLEPVFEWNSWPVLPIFSLIQDLGNVPLSDMRQTFNMGIGLVMVLEKDSASNLSGLSDAYPYSIYQIGEIRKAKA